MTFADSPLFPSNLNGGSLEVRDSPGVLIVNYRFLGSPFAEFDWIGLEWVPVTPIFERCLGDCEVFGNNCCTIALTGLSCGESLFQTQTGVCESQGYVKAQGRELPDVKIAFLH